MMVFLELPDLYFPKFLLIFSTFLIPIVALIGGSWGLFVPCFYFFVQISSLI
jgi:hypothetical protein